MAAGGRSGTGLRRAIGLLVTGLLVGGAAFGAALPASGAVVDGVITSITVREDEVGVLSRVTTDIEWCAPDGTASGDTVTVQLPAQLRSWPASFPLHDPQGDVVADAVIVDRLMTLTFSDYVDAHENVCGSAFVAATMGSYGDSTQTLVYTVNERDVFRDTVAVRPQNNPDRTSVYKRIGWKDESDQCRIDTDNCIRWRVQTPIGPLTDLTVVDTLGSATGSYVSGQVFDCSVAPVAVIGDDSLVNPFMAHRQPFVDFTMVSCDESGWVAHIPEVPAGKIVEITMVVDAARSSGGIRYANTARVRGPSVIPSSFTARGTSRLAGGYGDGDVVGIDKFATEDGPIDGDFDASPGKQVAPGDTTRITSVITNSGSNPLTGIAVTDTTVIGPAAIGLDCAFPDGSTGTRWDGPLPVGESFECTAVLPGMDAGVQHADTMTVVATGNGPVSAQDAFSARAEDAPPSRDAVSVGDLVWHDLDHDGVQDHGEPGMEGVDLVIAGPDGDPVTDVDGAIVPTTTTDADGRYSFDRLPPLPAGSHYRVTVSDVPGFFPTLTGGGTPETDSSNRFADSGDLTGDGDRDSALDFGFWIPEPRIAIEKTDSDGHDADAPQDAVDLGVDGAAELRIVVTNSGTEALSDVVVTDVTTGSGVVTGLECEFPDGGMGTRWDGSLEPGNGFACRADLTGVVAPHADTATVVSRGALTGSAVRDDDAYHANGERRDDSSVPPPAAPVPTTPVPDEPGRTTGPPLKTPGKRDEGKKPPRITRIESGVAVGHAEPALIVAGGMLVLMGISLGYWTIRRKRQDG